MPSCSVCLCVCLSVTFIDSVKTNKQTYLQNFSPSGSQAILVFPYQMAWQYCDGNPLTAVSNAGEVGHQCCDWPVARCYQHGAAGPRSCKLWHLPPVVSGRVCWWREMTTKCLWQEVSILHLIAPSNKSVAYITNNKRLCLTFCTIKANYWQTRSNVRHLCDSRAAC